MQQYRKLRRFSETARIINHLLIYFCACKNRRKLSHWKRDCGMVDLTEMVLEGLTESKIVNGTVAIFCIESTGTI